MTDSVEHSSRVPWLAISWSMTLVLVGTMKYVGAQYSGHLSGIGMLYFAFVAILAGPVGLWSCRRSWAKSSTDEDRVPLGRDLALLVVHGPTWLVCAASTAFSVLMLVIGTVALLFA